jgi:hypothetical protein
MNFGRRKLMEWAAAGSSVAFLSSFARWSVAQAEGVTRPNVIFFLTPFTYIYGLYPQLCEGATKLSGYKYPDLLAPVLAESSKVTVISGLHNAARVEQHGSRYATFTCMPHITPPTPDQEESDENSRPGGPSIDQVIAQSFKAKTGDPVLSLNFGIPTYDAGGRLNDLNTSLLASAADQKLLNEVKPDKVFARLFGSLTTKPGQPSPEQLDAVGNQKILDLLRADVDRVRKRIPTSDRPKLDQMFESAGSLQLEMQKLANLTSNAACAVPSTAPALGPASDVAFNADYKPTYRGYLDAVIDNTVLAMSCGLSRVATLDLGTTFYPDLLLNLQQHECTHGFTTDLSKGYPADWNRTKNAISDMWLGKTWGGEAGWRAVNAMYMGYLAKLVKKLKATPTGNGQTLFDNTIIVAMSSSGCADHWAANEQAMVLAGGHPALPAGQYYRFGETKTTTEKVKQPLQGARFTGDLFSFVANAAGVPMGKFGDSRFAAGPLSFT